MWLFKRTTKITEMNKDKRVYAEEDYNETYMYGKIVLLLLGIRLTRKDSPGVKLFWDSFYWFSFVHLFLTEIVDLVYLRGLIKNGSGSNEDVTKIFRMLPCIGYLALALLKTYKIVYYRPVFENLVDELRSMWPQGVVSDEEDDVISKALNEVHFVVKAFFYCNFLLVLSAVVPPFYDIFRRSLGHDIPRVLSYNYWTPYDSSQPGWFELTLTLQSWETMVTIWSLLAGDILFCVFLSHITMQFDLLCIRIQRLFYVPIDKQLIASYPLGEYDANMSEDEKLYLRGLNDNQLNDKNQRDLSEIVIRHNALIRLSNDIEEMFSFSLLFNFFYGSIIICFCGFCSVMIEKWNEFMYKSFLASSMTQIWLLCWYGQKLLDSSLNVSDALYNCAWYTTSRSIKKSILIMIHRSQNSVHITTYGFSIICLTSYTAIIKTAWSYFTLLLSTFEV